MTINVGGTYIEKGATASDEKDGNITSKIQISGVVNTSKAGTYTVTYKTGKYTPGRPYKLSVKVEKGQMTVTDCRNGFDGDRSLGGHQTSVVLKEGAYNLMAREYWFDSASAITNPNNVTMNNSSFVVIHAIDDPLIYADGQHYDSKGNKILTQFTYTYKPLTKE